MAGGGWYILGGETVVINRGRPVTRLRVVNRGDRPIQVGSHYHFFEVNRALVFDRERAFGQRLNIPAGTAVRFEPGVEREVELVPFAGLERVEGFAGLTQGSLRSEAVRRAALARARRRGFLATGAEPAGEVE